ncbi:MAG: hypothetical protein HY847_12180 [Betaproteobacteria bacterium]|nr:hypothetical protein [Betaproteobacteria bacterium]
MDMPTLNRFKHKTGTVTAEKVLTQDVVSGNIGNGSGSISTVTTETQEFFLQYDGETKKNLFRTEGQFRVSVGDHVRVYFYEFRNQQAAVGFLNLNTRHMHPDGSVLQKWMMEVSRSIRGLISFVAIALVIAIGLLYSWKYAAVLLGLSVLILWMVGRARRDGTQQAHQTDVRQLAHVLIKLDEHLKAVEKGIYGGIDVDLCTVTAYQFVSPVLERLILRSYKPE